MKFNEKLISLRKSMGLSQEELGAELKVSRQTISKWESGQSYPDFQRLVLLSDYFGLTLDELWEPPGFASSAIRPDLRPFRRLAFTKNLCFLLLRSHSLLFLFIAQRRCRPSRGCRRHTGCGCAGS